jgi:threonine dehydrogenase-like Zn-dependent dehydrogenase
LEKLTMRALVVEPGARPIALREIFMPKPGQYEALVRMRGCGICSTTDWEIIKGRQPFHHDYPAVLGHEAVGEVIETGPGVESFRAGDLVSRPVAIWPGEKRDGLASAWGGFAEYGVVRDAQAMVRAGDRSLEQDYTALRQQVLPAGLSTAEAVLVISLAETASWFRHLPPLGGKSVAIAGTGIAGLGMVLWSLFAGAGTILVLGRREERLELARKVGATHGIDVTAGDVPARVRAQNGGRGVDAFLEAVGLPDQIELGLACLAPGGTVAVYGVPEGQRYALSWGAGPGNARIAQYPAEEHLAYGWVTRMMGRGLIPTALLMTHRWTLDGCEDAFAAVAEGSVVKGWIEFAAGSEAGVQVA